MKKDFSKRGWIKNDDQIEFRIASNDKEAAKHLSWGKANGYTPIIASHGWPGDSTDQMKSMFGVQRYPRWEFENKINTAIGATYLTGDTTWYSCDSYVGKITPKERLDRDAENRILWIIDHK